MVKKVTIIYLILSLAVLLVAGTFFYFGTKKCQEENINQPVGEDNQEQGYQIIPAEKIDCEDELDVSCWNTYRNEEHGFEFKYPGGWESFGEGDNEKLINLIAKDDPDFSYIYVRNYTYDTFGLIPEPKTVKEFREFSLNNNEIVEEIKQDKISALYYPGVFHTDMFPNHCFPVVKIFGQETVLSINMEDIEISHCTRAKNILLRIFSTFKVID